MMERVGARDRPEIGVPLTPLEMAFLDGIIRLFIKGISDFDIKKEAARGLSSLTRSFYSVYSLAEETRQTKIEITKLADAEEKEKQLQYYIRLAEKNTSTIDTRPSQNGNTEAYLSNSSSRIQPTMASRANQSGDNKSSYNIQTPVFSNNNRLPIAPYKLPTNLPDRLTSQNPFINKTRTWTK